MSKQHGKLLAFLPATVYTWFLCLLLVACGFDDGADDANENSQGATIYPKKTSSNRREKKAKAATGKKYSAADTTTPDDSGMASGNSSGTINRNEEGVAGKNSSNAVAVNITPGDSGMTSGNSSVTINGDKGGVTVKSSSNAIAINTTPGDSGMASGNFSVAINEDTGGVTRKNSSNFIAIHITPGGSGMTLKDFFITATVDGEKGEVNGHRGIKTGRHFVYDVALKDCCLETLWLQPQANCLGQEDNRFAQGYKISLKVKFLPNTAIPQGEQYTLTVSVERKGSNPYTSTQSTTLTTTKASPSKRGKRTSP